MKPNENYYEILKVERNASVSEIVQAYHSAKAAFSGDSVATYSLMSADEASEVLDKIEEAYVTLSNVHKKREYDRWLSNDSGEPFSPEEKGPQTAASVPAEPVLGKLEESPTLSQSITPTFLKDERERRGLSLDDIARITKIPVKFLISLETMDVKRLPARVYVQGFIKNLASLYKLDPKETARLYLEHLDNLFPPSKKHE